MLSTMAGLLPALNGSTHIHGVDVSTAEETSLRATVGVFPEDAHLFDTTVLENLHVVTGDLTEDAAVAALQKVGLGEWLDNLPAGVHTQLVGGAEAVSGGERRRILLARALVSQRPVVFLDEPTEHMDAVDVTVMMQRILAADAGVSGEHAGHSEDAEEACGFADAIRTGEDSNLPWFGGEGELVGGVGAARANGEVGDGDAARWSEGAEGVRLRLVVGAFVGQGNGREGAVGGMLAVFRIVEFRSDGAEWFVDVRHQNEDEDGVEEGDLAGVAHESEAQFDGDESDTEGGEEFQHRAGEEGDAQ